MDDDIFALHQSLSEKDQDTTSNETTDPSIDNDDIEAALNKLTDSGSSVNICEVDLQQAMKERVLFKKESKQRQKELEGKLHSHIVQAKPFVVLCRKVKEMQEELTQSAASVYKAKMEYNKAKYMYFPHSGGKKKSETWSDAAWQEMRRQAMDRIEQAKNVYSDEKWAYAIRCAKFEEALKECQKMKKKLKTSIQKSRPYFIERYRYHHHLKEFDKTIYLLRTKVREQKAEYTNSLKRLETLSDHIHEAKKRSNKSCSDVSKLKDSNPGNADGNLLQVSPNQAIQRIASEPIYLNQSHSDAPELPEQGEMVAQDSGLPLKIDKDSGLPLINSDDSELPLITAGVLILPQVNKPATQPVTRRVARHMLEENTGPSKNN